MPSSALMKITSPGSVDPSPHGHVPPFETTAEIKAVNWLLPRPGGPPSNTSLPSGILPGQTQTSFSGLRSLARWLIRRRGSFFGCDDIGGRTTAEIGAGIFAQ